ncbi:MAG: hypothetical protein V4692_04820 [Bdellovibrionota bacterium]
MDQFLASLPKTVVAVAVIVIGFLLIVMMNPPKTVCDSQLELFRESQKEFLYPVGLVAGEKKPPEAKRMFELCQSSNSPGGCFELFHNLKKLNADLVNVPAQCGSEALGEPAVKEWLFKSIKLMVQIPWGQRGPATVLQKTGWFDSSDLALYCDLSKTSSRLMGAEAFKAWRETVVSELPGIETGSREQVWGRSLFSIGCAAYR